MLYMENSLEIKYLLWKEENKSRGTLQIVLKENVDILKLFLPCSNAKKNAYPNINLVTCSKKNFKP